MGLRERVDRFVDTWGAALCYGLAIGIWAVYIIIAYWPYFGR